jgi:hypothetical protein
MTRFRIDVLKKYPDVFYEAIEKECKNCDSDHPLGSCVHQKECTEDYMKNNGWLMA